MCLCRSIIKPTNPLLTARLLCHFVCVCVCVCVRTSNTGDYKRVDHIGVVANKTEQVLVLLKNGVTEKRKDVGDDVNDS